MAGLTGPERAAASGAADSLVVFLHGYGADGADLIGLAEPLAAHLPNTRFLAPNAPQRCVNNPMGYQWFPIPWLDGSSPTEAGIAAGAAFAALGDWLDGVAGETPPERTVLVGFSQGTMMALQVGLRREALAGIVGFSGRLLQPERLKAEIVSRPPVFLAHGDADPVVPFASLAEAETGLKAAGVPVEAQVMRGAGHGIEPQALGKALRFVQRVLGSERAAS